MSVMNSRKSFSRDQRIKLSLPAMYSFRPTFSILAVEKGANALLNRASRDILPQLSLRRFVPR